ncbi:MAG TPA: hypothetical protein VF614_11805 [Chthoniobacteraceae bacterium]|jgi:hypothetical protein
MTEEQLSALLRLKRYEQPEPQYFDRLLTDIHRRQRAELLQRPLWRIMIERVQTAFSEHSMGSSSYAGAMATALVVGLAAIGVLLPGGVESNNTRSVASTTQKSASKPMLSLQAAPVTATELGEKSFQTVSTRGDADYRPRYVIDARPVSYEASFKF